MKNKVLFAVAILTAMLFTACEGNDPSGIKEKHVTPTTMYVGVTGFNNQLYFYTGNPDERYAILDKNTLNEYVGFVNSLSMAKNTALFWAVDDNLDHLKYCQFPDDIENISIVTFTDGLENGSGPFDNRFLDIEDYESNLKYLNQKINNTTIQGKKVTAYSVGVQGNDVTNVARFDKTLVQLSSGEGYYNKVEDISQLNETFKKIADDLYKQNVKPQLTVAVPPQVRKERIVFDEKSPEESEIYVEATKLKESPLKYSNISYKGCKSDSGNEVEGYVNSEGSKVFVFENFTDEAGNKLNYSRTFLWYWDGTQWSPDAEYDSENGAQTEEVHKSAAIMLVLDCSESLHEDNRFGVVKKAAVNFLETLVSTTSSSGTDPGTDPGTETAYYIKHPWGSGADSSWSWKKMTKINDGNYEYSGLWGGVGANINTTASDNGAQWFDASSISGASSLSVGDGVKFTYNSSTNKLSATKTSSGGSSNKTQVRFSKENAYEYVLSMSIEKVNGGEWESTEAEHEFGTASGTSNYYDISSGVLYPMFYYDDGSESGWYYALDSKSYNFVAGKKYTYTCSDDGTYLTFSIQLDGNAGAPAKVIASRRIQKTKIHNLSKVRK